MGPLWDYRVVELLRFVDGDTLDVRLEKTVSIDIGFHINQQLSMTTVQRLRLLGIDTPERNEAGYTEANSFARHWLTTRFSRGVLRARTEKRDAFGRWLADVYDSHTMESLGAALIRAGHAVPMTGRG